MLIILLHDLQLVILGKLNLILSQKNVSNKLKQTLDYFWKHGANQGRKTCLVETSRI